MSNRLERLRKTKRYSHCDRQTPSYRLNSPVLPHANFVCSGQTDADRSVLNKDVVCIPPNRNASFSKQRLLHSLEDYDGAKMRRNVYEDVLFKVEDERFEVDIAIECNASAMKQIEPLSDEASSLKNGEERDGQPIGRLQYKIRNRSLGSVHVGAIARVYGEKGDEVVHHSLRNPVVALPIVFSRLRQKDAEWRRVRSVLMKHWRPVTDSNYRGSLDVLCYFYKRELEKSFGSESLLEVCQRARHYLKHPKKQQNKPATSSIMPSFHAQNPKNLLFQPHITVKLNNSMPHRDAYVYLMLTYGGIAKTSADREKLSRIWTEFLVPWFDLPVHWFLRESRDRLRSDKSSTVTKYARGQTVRTAYGDARIVSIREGPACLHYEIKLPHAIAYVRPSAIVHAIPHAEAQFARSGGVMQSVELPAENAERPAAKFVFGTEKMYLFLRLYASLLQILDEARTALLGVESAERDRGPVAGVREEVVDAEDLQKDHGGYPGLLAALGQYVAEEISSKTFECRCRSISDHLVFKLAALPRLLEKCAEAMVKVAREDACLGLFDFAQLENVDISVVRSKSLALTSDAVYRIQYGDGEGRIHFAYLPEDLDMLLSPKTNPAGALEEHRERNENDCPDGSDGERLHPPNKRIKLKI